MHEINPKGYHAIAELSECNSERIRDTKYLLNVCYEACIFADLNVLSSYVVKFKSTESNEEDSGSSIFLVLEQSHFSVHTWPERRYAGVDIYSCDKNKLKPLLSLLYFAFRVEAQHILLTYIERGIDEDVEIFKHYVSLLEKKIKCPTKDEIKMLKHTNYSASNLDSILRELFK